MNENLNVLDKVIGDAIHRAKELEKLSRKGKGALVGLGIGMILGLSLISLPISLAYRLFWVPIAGFTGVAIGGLVFKDYKEYNKYLLYKEKERIIKKLVEAIEKQYPALVINSLKKDLYNIEKELANISQIRNLRE